MIRRLILRLVLLLLALAFLDLVWPTPYRYDHVVVEGDTYPVRIHRWSGNAEMLTPDEGWVPMEPGEGSDTNPAQGGQRI